MRRATSHFALLLSVLVLAAGCGRGCGRGRPAPGPHSHRAAVPEHFVDLARDGRLAIRSRDGPIRVRAGDVAQARVSGEVEGRSRWADEAKGLSQARLVRVGTDPDGRTLVEARSPRGRAIGATVHLEVTVPQGVDLLVETLGRGDIDVEGITGPLTARAVEGAIRLRAVSGAVTASTRRLGAVEVSGAVAEMHVDAAGAARVETTAPRLARDSGVIARRGDAEVRVPADFAAVVSLAAPRGATSDDFSLPRADGGVAGARLGAGGARLTISSRRGNAALRRR
ncbi:MAG: hypothetical protein HY906_02745 [Deltaproteobacteria bacterium]|nr:hypothetical protein [Deltaproteobacteria bacterium]